MNLQNKLINFGFISVWSLIYIASCQDKSGSLTTLRNDLLKNYYRYNRPVKQSTTTVNVTFQFVLSQIIDVNIETQTFRVNGLVRLWWKDEYLVWDPVKYPGINYISFRSDEIWTPDFKLLDSAIGSDPLDSLFIRVQNDGRVFQLLNADLLVNADLDLTNYPFDSQSCILQFGSYFYRTDEVEILKQTRFISGPWYQSPEWIVDHIEGDIYSQRSNFANFSTAYFDIQITRRMDIHVYYILLPYLTASLLGLVVFLLPIGSYYRMVFAGLSLFILVIILVFLADHLGFHSAGVPYTVRCISILLLLIGISLIVTTLTHQLIMNAMVTCPPLPSFLAHHLANPFLVKILWLSGDIMDAKPFDAESNLDEFTTNQLRLSSYAAVREWVRLLQLIDRLLFLTYIVSLIFYHGC